MRLTTQRDVGATLPTTEVWHLAIGQELPASGPLRLGGWRVLSGALRLDPLRHAPTPAAAVQLALPGDVVGLEALCEQPPMFRARALLPCQVQPLAVPMDPALRARRLAEALGRCWQRSAEMASLRHGPVHERMARLLRALAASQSGDGVMPCRLPADAPPRLPSPRPRGRDLAELLDTTPETVSRVLAQWRRNAPLDPVAPPATAQTPVPPYHALMSARLAPGHGAALQPV